MREVREIFQRVLDEPQPPLRGTDEIARVARRAARRRARLTAGGLAVAVLAVVLTGVLIVRTPLAARPGPPPAAPAASSPSFPLASMPSLHTVDAHTAQTVAMLSAAVPPGLNAGPSQAQYGWASVLRDNVYGTAVRVQLLETGGAALEVYYVFDAALAAPACSAAAVTAAAEVLPGADRDCTVAPAEGQEIQVTTGPRVIEAVRFLRGGFVSVIARQGNLATPPVTPTELAALAADPDLLP